MVNFTLVGLVLAILTKHIVECSGVMTVQGIPVHFESSYFNRFIRCLSDGYKYCYAGYDIYQSINYVNIITTSNDLTNSTRPYIYNCQTKITNVSTYHHIITCEAVDQIQCVGLEEICSLFPFAIYQMSLNFIDSDILKSCVLLCSDFIGIKAYNKREHFTTVNITTTSTTNALNTSLSTTVSPTWLTTTRRYPTRTSTSHLFNTSIVTFSTTVTDIDREEENNPRTIIISLCVAGVVVLILCSVLSFLVWWRRNTARSEKSDITKSAYNKTNGISFKENRNGVNANNKKRNETVSLKEYSNAMLVDEYTSISEEGTRLTEMQNPIFKQNNGDYNNTVICTNEEVQKYTNNRMGENKNIETCQGTVDYSNIADTAISDYHRHLDGYTTIEETGNNSSKTNTRDDENCLVYYNNMLIEKIVIR